ncbi:MAG: hypothetical protein GXP08_09525 [Gammaproteobacteria bacterium]|nr:hypothetical protein [Gammaproteobacteria bacterium]
MDIYIGNLPERLESSELDKILRFALLPDNLREFLRRFFNKKDWVYHSEFKVMDETIGDRPIRYVRAVIEPECAARRVLQRLDHLTLQGSSLRARPYWVRSQRNDRRHRQLKNLYAVNAYNRRLGDRRRQL